MADIPNLIADVEAETDELLAVVTALDAEQWVAATPAPGWTIGDQLAHLRVVEQRALLSASDAESFLQLRRADMADPERLSDLVVEHRRTPPDELVAEFLTTRRDLMRRLGELAPGTRLAWYGPEMGVASMLTARLMETWAHGQDVRDALRLAPSATQRLRHICRLGMATRSFSYVINGRQAPESPVSVVLGGLDGEQWQFGDPEAGDVVAATAVDFCLIVTRRRHLADTDISVTGDAARDWLQLARAFAGPPGDGRRPGQFASRAPSAADTDEGTTR